MFGAWFFSGWRGIFLFNMDVGIGKFFFSTQIIELILVW